MKDGRVIVLSGGVGGAKLVLGLTHALLPERLIVVTNTGDDFDHLGLRICPDTDTVIYALSGLADPDRGWGRRGETWTFMSALGDLGGADWFRLGDGDLAMHVSRTDRLRRGATLTEVTAGVTAAFGIETTILPMSDQAVATVVETPAGRLPFQHYFVRERCAPPVTGIDFEGIDAARPNPSLAAALAEKVAAVLIAPSNPFVSIDPILALPGLRALLSENGAPIVAVSPIVGGVALKGPAAKMMRELGLEVSALGIAQHYAGLIDGMIVDDADAGLAAAIEATGIEVRVAPTVMRTLEDRINLATVAIDMATCLQGRPTH